MVVGKETRPGEIIRAGGEVVGQRAVDEAERDGFRGFGALRDEEELVVPESCDGVVENIGVLYCCRESGGASGGGDGYGCAGYGGVGL